MSENGDDSDVKVCTGCVSKRFADWIRKNGTRAKCDFNRSHRSRHSAISVHEFTCEVDRFFRENYQRGEEYMYASEHSDNPSYDTYGDSYENILAEELECDEPVLKAVLDCLSDYDNVDVAGGEEPFYEDVNYESIETANNRDRADQEEYWYERRFSYQWEEFCYQVQNQRRFFGIKGPLDELFGKPEEYAEGAVRPLYDLPAGTLIFRARVLDDSAMDERLAARPATELGAPPPPRARAGRMNVEYIPAFYAAFGTETALAEVRPTIGDRVAVGDFELLRPLKVFDFTVFAATDFAKWKEISGHTRFDFINQMEGEISKPIVPFEQQREYIATQIVAEYLREHFDVDAVIYHSSMHKSEGKDTRNIVIFKRTTDFVVDNDAGLLRYVRHRVMRVSDIAYSADDEEVF
jgi:hypothetical protein